MAKIAIIETGGKQYVATEGGVLTIENKEQAHVRIRSGYGATEAALQSAKIIENM